MPGPGAPAYTIPLEGRGAGEHVLHLSRQLFEGEGQDGLWPVDVAGGPKIGAAFQVAMRAGKMDAEGRAPPHFAFHADEAAALLHDAIDGRKPEPGPFADRLCGEEGIEDLAD